MNGVQQEHTGTTHTYKENMENVRLIVNLIITQQRTLQVKSFNIYGIRASTDFLMMTLAIVTRITLGIGHQPLLTKSSLCFWVSFDTKQLI